MRNRIVRNLICGLGVGLVCLVLAGSGAQAQEFRSTLTGQVTDPSGAVVPNAAVTAVKNDTHQTYQAKTDHTGIYSIPYMLPGLYTVMVKAPGFKTHVQEKVLLQASQRYGLNVRLQVGAATQRITVTSAPPLINTASGSSANMLTGREIENLPLNGRQIYMLIGTTPGSQFLQTQFGASGYSGTRGWDVSNNYALGGGVQGYNMFTLDGTNITEMGGFGPEGTWIVAPNVDAVQEVNVMSDTYDAKYGHSTGGTVNMVTKSGTNQFHGDLYEYLENGSLNANNFENNANDVARGNTIQHQYGGTFGGPIKKNKIFFFGSFEGYWEDIPFTTLTSVPPAYLHPQPGQGVNFTATGYKIYDPATTVCESPGGTLGNCKGNNYSRTEFPNDTIPANRIDPTGVALLNLFPMPNVNPGSIINNYIATTPDKYRYYQPMIRVDYTTSERTRWYSLFEWQKGHEFRDSSGFTGPAETGNINTMRENIVASQDMTHTFSPSMVGDFKLSFTRFMSKFPNGPLSTPTPSSIGLNMPDVPTASKSLLPQIGFSELYPGIVGNSVDETMNQTMVLNVDFTKIHGAHGFEFGGEVGRWNFANPFSVGHPNGTFSFGTQPTQQNPFLGGTGDGNPIATLLLGYPTGGSVDWEHTVYETIPEYAIYGQDNWRVSHRLTLNIGLRYDVLGGVVDRFNGLNRGMCLTCVNPITNTPTYEANITNSTNIAKWQAATAGIDSTIGATGPAINPGTVYGGLQFTGAYGQPRNAYNIDWGNLAPRLGFAYAINPKTVIRGGWGFMFAYGIEGGTRSGFSISTPYTTSLNGGATPADYFLNGTPYPSGAIQPVGSSLGLETNLGNGGGIDFPQRKIPRSTMMSLGFQRALPGHTTLSMKYSGNYARALRTQGVFQWINGDLPLTWGYPELQQNNYNSTLASELNARVPNPYYGVVPVNSGVGSSSTIDAVNLLVPLSQFGLVGDYTNPYGKSWYDSLQVKLDKRLYGSNHGLSYQLAYTYSKNMELTSYRNGWPWQDPHPIYEPVGYDRTSVLSLAGEWDLPMGRGSRYIFRNASGTWGEAINGWRMDWLFSDSSGTPLGIPDSWYVGGHGYVPTGGPTFSQWIYNCGGAPKSCYTPIPSRGQGNQPDRVGYLRNPYIPNLDLSLQKEFHLTESKQLQFRADAFNLMNTPLFPGPNENTNQPPQLVNGRWQGFGTINFFQQNFPRIVQLSLKLFF
jgi:hypothetical protein